MKFILASSSSLILLLIGTVLFGLFTGSLEFVEGQLTSAESIESGVDFMTVLVNEVIAVLVGFLGIGITALLKWLQRQGVPISTEQEAMFKDLVTKRFTMLAKDSWTQMRQDYERNPKIIDEYWKELKTGHVPIKYQEILRNHGKEFATKLKSNKEFRDFAKNLSDSGMDALLKDSRAQLKADYQKRMVDVLPKIASIAVDSAFDENVKDAKQWSNMALEKIKPLILSSEALDTEENIVLIIQSEVNRRLQQRMNYSR